MHSVIKRAATLVAPLVLLIGMAAPRISFHGAGWWRG
jgi:hypothetical protein